MPGHVDRAHCAHGQEDRSSRRTLRRSGSRQRLRPSPGHATDRNRQQYAPNGHSGTGRRPVRSGCSDATADPYTQPLRHLQCLRRLRQCPPQTRMALRPQPRQPPTLRTATRMALLTELRPISTQHLRCQPLQPPSTLRPPRQLRMQPRHPKPLPCRACLRCLRFRNSPPSLTRRSSIAPRSATIRRARPHTDPTIPTIPTILPCTATYSIDEICRFSTELKNRTCNNQYYIKKIPAPQ